MRQRSDSTNATARYTPQPAGIVCRTSLPAPDYLQGIDRVSLKELDRIADGVFAHADTPAELPKVVAGAADRPLAIGDVEIQCYVLEDGTRVLTQASFLESLGRHPKANVRKEGGEERIPAILQGKAINPFISQEILAKSAPVRFRTEKGSVASGYRAELLPSVCEIYLAARDAGVLPKNQQHVARHAEILIRGLAQVGIIALVDEATGYQRIRAENALAKILEKFIVKELQGWTKTFPIEFYEQICRLKGWPPVYAINRPSLIGKYTNDLVYERIAPGVLDELKRINPVVPETGRRQHKHHQWFTPDVGHPKLQQHLGGLLALMRLSTSWDSFRRKAENVFPKFGDTAHLGIDED